jgi:hypothetical protein
MTVNDELACEIDRIEATLRSALEELASRLQAGDKSDDIRELAKHCREMSDLLLEAAEKLEETPDAQSVRETAARLVAQVIMLERDMARGWLH